MVRPKKCCMVDALPGVTYFKPAGIPLRFLGEVCLVVEEAEALRLKDVEGLEQVEGARRMGISRPTFQRVLASARKKVADAILNGKAIRIEGGSFRVADVLLRCAGGHNWVSQTASKEAGDAVCAICGTPAVNMQPANISPGRENQEE